MSAPAPEPKRLWEESFDEQIARRAFNTAPVEALVRTIAYHLRDRFPAGELGHLHFLELGCGAGPNLAWLAEKGIRVSGVDLARNALRLARATLARAGAGDRIGGLVEGSAADAPFRSGSFDGVIEACVFQHLARADRERAFAEVGRLLRPGGVFVGYMLDVGHSTFVRATAPAVPGDPGSLWLADGGSKIHLTNIGLAHFFTRDEFARLLPGFTVVDPCLTTYQLPRAEAAKRGYESYLQSMWTVLAIK